MHRHKPQHMTVAYDGDSCGYTNTTRDPIAVKGVQILKIQSASFISTDPYLAPGRIKHKVHGAVAPDPQFRRTQQDM